MTRHDSRPARRLGALALIALLAALSPGCSDGGRTGAGAGGGGGVGQSDEGVTPIDRGDVTARLDGLPTEDLTDEEVAGLARMREEELLARDVYRTLDDRWGTRIFANISSAEQTHTDAVAALLDRHRLADPAAQHEPGTFRDAELQSLYTSLVEQGAGSLVDALAVGATVEELDLADLAARATDTADIAWVYDNLARGSRNHLRAFARQLERQGATFTPSHITQAEFDSITSSGVERGGGS